MTKIWKDVVDYGGLYEVSNDGDVRSKERFVEHSWLPNTLRLLKGQVRKAHVCTSGYRRLKLSKGGVSKMHRVHRLVMEAHVPNTSSLPLVNHKDLNKLNNSIENLEWCTAHLIFNMLNQQGC